MNHDKIIFLISLLHKRLILPLNYTIIPPLIGILTMSLPEGYTIRRTTKDDFAGVTSVLKVLTTVGDVSQDQFHSLIDHWDSVKIRDIPMYNSTVIVDTNGEVVATGNVLVEKKVIHECGLVGHIEDIAVRKDQQGKKLGLILIQYLYKLANEYGCYKVILDCDESNVGFYEKCGLKKAGVEMQIRFDK
ncbi:Gna1 [Kluyveromyces lactis]|nr:Gna1 [Kluyveromyces lactis]